MCSDGLLDCYGTCSLACVRLRPAAVRTYDVVVEHAQLHAYDYGLRPCVPTQLLWNTLNRTYDVAHYFAHSAVAVGTHAALFAA